MSSRRAIPSSRLASVVWVGTLLAGLAGPLRGDGEMWMPQQVPALAAELRELGLELDPASFADLTGFPMGAIVNAGGCSATFVSPDGLLATNHHCVFGSLQYNATPERDVLTDGFLAATRTEELPASPTVRVYVTESIEDVTEDVLGRVPADATDLERFRTVRRRRRELVRECEAVGDVRCEVPVFFGGELVLRLRMAEIRDVRLVYAPALGIGNFGDEEDNWIWPRHTGDFGFYRAYVGPDGRAADPSPENVPYRPAHHLRVSSHDLDPGDLVLIAGYPGKTSRLATAAEIRDARDRVLPEAIRRREVLLDILQARGEGDRAVALANASRIARLENFEKKYRGVLAAIERDQLLERKLAEEARIEALLAADDEAGPRWSAAHAELLGRLSERAAASPRETAHEWILGSSPMLTQADRLVRLAEARAIGDDLDRPDGYQERDWERLAGRLRSTSRSIERGSDRAGLRWALGEALGLPQDQRIEALDRALAGMPGGDPEARLEAFLDHLYAGTRIDDVDRCLELFGQPPAELHAEDDAMIAFARELRTLGREIAEAEEAFEGTELRLRPALVDALRLVRGGNLAPDANSTLRVTFGRIRGYAPRDGVEYAAQTTIRGVLEKDTGVRPFDSPPRLLELARKGRFGPYTDPELGTLPVAYVSTASVTNGSSGSSVLDARGDVVGLAYDMTWESVGADWVVEEAWVRTIHLDMRYMLWVMDAVDGAHDLLREMGLPVHFPDP